MNDTLSSTRSSPALLYVAALGAVLLGLAAMSGLPASLLPLTDGAAVADAPAGQVFEAQRVKKQTRGQLEEIASHLSKMQGGESVGGFPGFEPPEDDADGSHREEYRREIKNRSYPPEKANHWLQEINGLLKWIIRKNPGLSFREILQRQGSTQVEIADFIERLQRAHYTAKAMSGYGVNPETVKILESLMKTLGVPTWQF